MADQDNSKTVTITAVDDTTVGLASAQKNFARLPTALQKDYKQLATGLVVAMKDVERLAKEQGHSAEEQLKLMNEAAQQQQKHDDEIEKARRKHDKSNKDRKKSFLDLDQIVGKGAGALGKMAVKALEVGAAIETVREGYKKFGEYDTNLRRLQNSIGGTRTQIEAFGTMIKDVALTTGEDVGELQRAFKEFIDLSQLKPEQAKKMFPDIALYAQGAGASVSAMAHVMGDAVRIFGIPAEGYNKALEAIVRTADDLNVDVGALGEDGTRAMEVMAALGYKGNAGLARMTTFIGVANKATGNTRTSVLLLSNLMEKMISGDQGIADALDMPVQVMLDNIERIKAANGDVLGWMIGQFAGMKNEQQAMRAVGLRDARVVRQLQKEVGNMNDEIERTTTAAEGREKSERLLAGPEKAVARLSTSISLLVMELGHMLDAFGVTTVIQTFADLIGLIATTMSRLVDLVVALFRWEMPAWMPKTMGEFKYDMTAPRIRGGLETPWSETPEGKAEQAEAAKNVAEEKKKVAAKRQAKAAEAKPAEVEVEVETKPAKDWATPSVVPNVNPYSVGQRPGVNIVGRPGPGVPPPEGQPITSASPAAFKQLGDVFQKAAGGGYGSSLDAKYMQASYHPGGGLGGGGGGGAGGGGGYGPAGAPSTGGADESYAPPSHQGGDGGHPSGDGVDSKPDTGAEQPQTASVPPTGPVAPGGSPYRAKQREALVQEYKNFTPYQKRVMGYIMKHESKDSLESLFNRVPGEKGSRVNPGGTLWEGLTHGQYSTYPAAKAAAAAGRGDPAATDALVAPVAAGSNVLEGRSDQGMWNDPGHRVMHAPGAAEGTQVNAAGVARRLKRIHGEWYSDKSSISIAKRDADLKAQREYDAAQGTQTAQAPPPAAPVVAGGPSDQYVKEDQARVAGIRKKPLSAATRAYLEGAGRETGLRADIYSGGQEAHGPHRTGSHRHDEGGAGDLKLWDPVQKRYLNSSNPADAKRMEAYTAAAVKYGATGVGQGAGYMGDESIHIGGGKQASWGGGSWIERARRTGMAARGPSGQPLTPPKPEVETAAAPEGAFKSAGGYKVLEQKADVDVKVRDTEVQQAKASLKVSNDNEQRSARAREHADIGAA